MITTAFAKAERVECAISKTVRLNPNATLCDRLTPACQMPKLHVLAVEGMILAKIERFKYYEDAYGATVTDDNLALTTHTKTKAVFEDTVSGDSYVLKGDGFRYKGGMLQSGDIESMTVLHHEVGTVSKLSNSDIDASKLPDADILSFIRGYAAEFFEHNVKIVGTKVTDQIAGKNGDDQIFGHGGADVLQGGKGQDMLSGGDGSDIFGYRKHDSHDTITDFSPGHDIIKVIGWTDCDIVKDGKNTILEFSNSDTLTLLDVKPGELHHNSIQYEV